MTPRRSWPCLDGPLAGERIPVSGLAAWTGSSETRRAVVQHVDGGEPRIAETDARGRLLTREGEIIIGHYGQTRWWERGFRFEGSPFPAVYDELRRDHRTPGGWREMASWQHVFEAATRRAA